MAHEAFNDEEVAEFLNDNFVSIKVDKEERPDIDDTYMQACQILSSSCGWPLNIIMTPENEPFWAGSYFSVKQAFGRPPFINVLKEVNKVWIKNQYRINEIIDNVAEQMSLLQESVDKETIGKDILIKAYESTKESFDPEFGGFEELPKFPCSHKLSFLLGLYISLGENQALEMAEKTLLSIYQGGIYDHVGGGIHRYSTDNQWKIPHFEKMLYDQALMANTYLEAYQVTQNELYAEIAKEILDFTIAELCNKQGGFYSGLDADSEGKEGGFYTWSKDEICNILEEESDLFCEFYQITDKGSFENNRNLIYMPQSFLEFAQKNNLDYQNLKYKLKANLKKLYAERKKRISPQRDNKIITAWNGMMIKSLSLASRVFNERKYKIAATKTCIFVLNKLITPEGKLLRCYCDGEATITGFLEDYVFFIYGLLELYEATFEVVYLKLALNAADKMIEDFYDEENGGFYFTSKHTETPLFRRKISFDNSIPSANAVAVLVLQKLADISQNQKYEAIVEKTFKEFSGSISNYPEANSQFLTALLYHFGRHRILLISENPDDHNNNKIIKSINKKLLQDGFILYKEKDNTEIEKIYKSAKNQQPVEDKTEVFICDKDACRPSLKGIEEIESYIKEE